MVSNFICFYALLPSKLEGPQSHWTPTSMTASLTLGHRYLHNVKPFYSLFYIILTVMLPYQARHHLS